MSKKKPQYNKKPFESTGVSSDTSANIYMSMLLSEAWKGLSAKQQVLYVYCKAQYYAEKKKPDGNELCFTMSKSKVRDLYGIYSGGNMAAFYRDIAALIDHGFIRCVDCGAFTRTKSIYRFSDSWQKYGKDEFIISDDYKTVGMIRSKKQG